MTLTSYLHFSFPNQSATRTFTLWLSHLTFTFPSQSVTPNPSRTPAQTFKHLKPILEITAKGEERRGEDAACAISGFHDCLRTPDSTGFQGGVRAEDQFQDTEVASGEVLFELVVAGYDVMGINCCFFEVFVRIWSFWWTLGIQSIQNWVFGNRVT